MILCLRDASKCRASDAKWDVGFGGGYFRLPLALTKFLLLTEYQMSYFHPRI